MKVEANMSPFFSSKESGHVIVGLLTLSVEFIDLWRRRESKGYE